MLCAAALLPACQRPDSGEILVAAAASLGDVLPPLLREHEAEDGLTARLALGSSGALAAQLRHGAPFDVLILAGAAPMDALESKGLILPETRRDLLGNELVLAMRARDASVLQDLAAAWRALRGRRVAIGAAGVPAGDYARAWIHRSGVEDSAVELVPLPHARAALAALQSGSCAAAFLYASDAAGRPGVRVALRAPAELAGAIRYPAAVCARSRHPEAAARLLDFLAAHPESFAAAGFVPLAP